ncbi:MAG: polysaccharide biosynthesis tyrosine autokinase [Cyanobacteria bacterium P01_A01_bin.45]
MVQSSLSPHVNPVVETEPGYGQLFAILIRRFPWFLTVFAASIAIAYMITERTPRKFQSSMQLLIEPNYRGRGQEQGNENQFSDPSVEIDTATQLNLMRSSTLLQKAVDKLQPEYPNINVGEIKQSLRLTQVREEEDNLRTKIFQADYVAGNPEKTEKVLEAIKQVYQEYNLAQQDERLRRGLTVINDQLRTVNKEVETSEQKLRRFRKTQKLIDPETQAKALEDSLRGIQQERRTTRYQFEEAKATYASVQQQLNRTPQNALVSSRLSQSNRYQSLLNEIQKTELAVAQAQLRFTSNHPQVIELQGQLQDQKLLLQQEVRRALGGRPQGVGSLQGNLLDQGQLGQIDLNLAGQLVDTQTKILSLAARDESLAQRELQIRKELQRFPILLAEYGRLQPQVQRSRERKEQLLRAKQQLRQELSKGGFNWKVVEEPQEGFFIGPNTNQNLMLGGVVGLILGGIAAFVREASDDAVRTTAELEQQFALPLLGTTPKLPPARPKDSVIKLPFGKPEVLAPWTVQVLQSPPRWESLDLIYKNIELLNSVSTFKSLMITSALPDEGKSALALGLAMSAARLHKRVLLIDANLRDPNLHKQLNLPNEQGLANLLANETPLPEQINVHSSGSSYIDILTAGPLPIDPANLLSSPRMNQLMANFENNYDLVIVDAPPVIGMVDALLTASSCRGAVMVASIGRVTKTQLNQATNMLSKLNLIGVVANGVSNYKSTYIPYQSQQTLALEQAIEE